MRGLHRVASLAVLLGASALGAAPPEVFDPVRLPFVEVVAPNPPPRAVTALAAEQLYVIDSDVELRVLASPEGVVSVGADAGPIKIRGKFVENAGGRTTTRTYKGPFVYTVEAATTGKVELLIVRTDGKGGVIRRTLDVTAGEGPIPPPKPIDPPTPPEPKPVTSFRVILVFESGQTMTPAQSGLFYGEALETYLTANCTGGRAGWDRRDKDKNPATDTTPLRDAWIDAKPKIEPGNPPCLAVVVNKTIYIEPLAATFAEQAKVLDKYRGGK